MMVVMVMLLLLMMIMVVGNGDDHRYADRQTDADPSRYNRGKNTC